MKNRGINTECSKVIAVRVSAFDKQVLSAVAEAEDIAISDVIRWALAVWQSNESERIQKAFRGGDL